MSEDNHETTKAQMEQIDNMVDATSQHLLDAAQHLWEPEHGRVEAHRMMLECVTRLYIGAVLGAVHASPVNEQRDFVLACFNSALAGCQEFWDGEIKTTHLLRPSTKH